MSIEPEEESRVLAAWDAEIRDRIRGYDEGLIASISASQVFKELDERLKG